MTADPESAELSQGAETGHRDYLNEGLRVLARIIARWHMDEPIDQQVFGRDDPWRICSDPDQEDIVQQSWNEATRSVSE